VFADLLRQKLTHIVQLSDQQVTILDAHYELLFRWNRILNLTAVISLEEAVERHYCESLFLGAHLPARSLRIVDVGSGAGFPGFPVAVLRPDCSVTLVESHRRKAVFLREAARTLFNIRVLDKRAAEVEETFDHAISRAVSYEDLVSLLEKLAPNADLLTGRERPPAALGFVWESPVPLPWGKQRFLRQGRRFT
jgi:16S rRNA (guanine527-N7)-methyltransferase